MMNVLMFPGNYAPKRKSINPIKAIIGKINERKRKNYEKKIKALREATYVFYLKELEEFEKKNPNSVFIPYFFTAEQMTNEQIKIAEKEGEKFISKCYKRLMSKK